MISENFKNYFYLFRFDHSIKQIFVIPGILIALSLGYQTDFSNLFIGFACIQLAASSNYIINEWLDRDFDKHNPQKKNRPSVVGKVQGKFIYPIYFFTSALTIYISFLINKNFASIIIFFLIMGIVYNVKPIRAKDVHYLDVIVESVNNPIRLLLGFFMFDVEFFLPSSIIIFYWSAGAFLMTCKRYAEYNFIKRDLLVKYRQSFNGYTINKLLILMFLTSSLSMSMLSIFMIKYKIEFILFIISTLILFIYYFYLSLNKNSIVKKIDHLYKDKTLLMIITFCIVVFIVSLTTEIEILKVLEKPLVFNFNKILFF